MNKGVVYAIINKINRKMYVGHTSNTFNRRYYGSWVDSTHNEHLKSSVAKYGEDNFEVVIICEGILDLELLGVIEYEIIEEYNLMNREHGYNKREGGFKGLLSEETKRKISLNRKGKGFREVSQETRFKLSRAMKGRIISEDAKRKLSEKASKRTHTEETKQKISIASSGENNGFYGKTHNEETRNRISNILKDKYKNGYVNPRKGVVMSEETKKRISNSKAETVGIKVELMFSDGSVKQFKTKADAYKYLNISRGGLQYWLKNGIPSKYKNKYLSISVK